jgi:phytoene dehydrogenase-like protein
VALARSLEAAAIRFGVEVRTGVRRRTYRVTNDRATGVLLDDGTRMEARTVVSAVDPKRTFLSSVMPNICHPSSCGE